MAHRRVKNIAYDDDDDADDYDEEEEEYGQGEESGELSAEDQEQMRQGTINVRQALGAEYQVSDKVIQDALWNYYYDVAKSVSYIKNTTKLATPKKPKSKTETRFDKAAAAGSHTTKEPRIVFPFQSEYGMPLEVETPSQFFQDIPWLQVPLERLSSLTPHLKYQGGLLGGSGKPSKLAALAAARRKKEEQKPSSHSEEKQPSDRALSLLDRLSNKDGKDSTASDPTKGKSIEEDRRPISLRPKPTSVESEESLQVDDEQMEGAPVAELYQVADLKAEPSTFADAMLGLSSRDAVSNNHQRHASIQVYDFPIGKAFTGPSPDDIVLSAQSKGSKPTKSSVEKALKPLNGEQRAGTETPTKRHRHLNVVEEFEKSNQKNAASFVVIGHVDHGKSTLMGRLLYDLKVVDQRSVDKLRREADTMGKSSFALAWIMDETSEERQRGVTTDFATNYFETDKTRFTILDAPGHQDYIPNMIAGASQADFAVLVIDASTGGFESGLRGQTKEHALLVRSMGVQQLIVVINKMDSADWSQERFGEISKQMLAFLTSAGFQSRNITFVPCSGLTGQNVVSPLASNVAAWYHGDSLVQVLDSMTAAKRALSSPLRLTVSDVFRGGTNNALSLTGRIDSGSLQVADQLMVMPSGEKTTIRSLEADNEPADWAVAGQIVTLHITDMDPSHLRTGDIVCSTSDPIPNLTTFTAKILAFEHIMPMFLNVHRGPLHVHGKVTKMIAVLDKATGEVTKKKPRVISPGAAARVEINTDEAVPLEKGVRVVLRADGQTVAAGLVE